MLLSLLPTVINIVCTLNACLFLRVCSNKWMAVVNTITVGILGDWCTHLNVICSQASFVTKCFILIWITKRLVWNICILYGSNGDCFRYAAPDSLVNRRRCYNYLASCHALIAGVMHTTIVISLLIRVHMQCVTNEYNHTEE